MKRISFIAVLLIAMALLLAVPGLPQRTRPLFTRFQTPPFIPASNHISYDSIYPRPFEGGTMWIYAWSATNIQSFLYYIDGRRILGQLTNGWAVTMIDQSKWLCVGPVPNWSPLKVRLVEIVEQVSRGRINLPRPNSEPRRYWLLDLEKNTAARMGDLPQRPKFIFQPSPDLRYGYTPLNGPRVGLDVYCFDFKRRSIKKLAVHGWPSGWWDHRNILVITTNRDIALHDLTTDKASLLISSGRIAEFLRNNLIPEHPKKTQAFWKTQAFCIWNGREYDFYLTDTQQEWAADESYLIKLERPDGRLRLLARRFKFERSIHFDPTGRYYLYSGLEAGQASDGVFLRDMQSGTNQTLVMPAGDRYFSIPRFYGDSIIYLRSNTLWRISLDGTKNVQLFPP